MALGSFLSRLGSAALPAAISAYGTYRGGEEDERWKGLDPRTSQGLEGFMGAAQAGLSGLHRHEQEKRARKLERERAEQARMANVISSISPRGGDYRPAPVETPKAGALEQVAQLGGAGIGAYKSALEHSRALEDREQQRQQRELALEKDRIEAEEKAAEAKATMAFETVGELPVQAEEYQQYMRDQGLETRTPQPLVREITDIQTPEGMSPREEAAYRAQLQRLQDAKTLRETTAAEEARKVEEFRFKSAGLAGKQGQDVGEHLGKGSLVSLYQYADDGKMKLTSWESMEGKVMEQLKSTYPDFTENQLKRFLPSAMSGFKEARRKLEEDQRKLLKESEAVMAKEGIAAGRAFLINQANSMPGVGLNPKVMEALTNAEAAANKTTKLSGRNLEKAAGYLTLQKSLDGIIENADNPDLAEDFTWIGDNWETVKGHVLQRTLDPEVNKHLTKVGLTAVMAAHLFSGAAVREEEFLRFRELFIGPLGVGKESLKARATIFRDYVQQQRLDTYNVQRETMGKAPLRIAEDGSFTLDPEKEIAKGIEDKGTDTESPKKMVTSTKGVTWTEDQLNEAYGILVSDEYTDKQKREMLTYLDDNGFGSDFVPEEETAEVSEETAEVSEETAEVPGETTEEVVSEAPPASYQAAFDTEGARKIVKGIKEFPWGATGYTKVSLKNIGDAADQNPLINAGVDTTVAPTDTTVAPTDTTVAPTDTTAVVPSLLEAQKRTTDYLLEQEKRRRGEDAPADSLVLERAIEDTTTETTEEDTFRVSEPWVGTINALSEETEVPVDMARRIIFTESRGKPDAVNSETNAIGLMQLTEVALKDLEGEGVEVDRSRLTDPEYNIELGMRYLRLTFDRLKRKNPGFSDGNLWIMTARAYHGGIGNVLKEQRGKEHGMGKLTDDYVENVTSGMADSLQMEPG